MTHAAKPSNESDQSCEVATVEMLPSSEFRKSQCYWPSHCACVMETTTHRAGIEQCRRRILTTPNFPEVPKDATEVERLLQLSSLLSLKSINNYGGKACVFMHSILITNS